jgi:thiamine pyrophosphokinase
VLEDKEAMTILIFANGDMQLSNWIEPFLKSATAVIAADGGTRHLMALSRSPDLLIGDLDSLAAGVKEQLERGTTRILSRSPEKDETDLELALLYAVDTYDEEIIVFAGLGGRLDQMFANILLLMHPKLRRRDISFKTRYQRIWLIEEQATIRGETGDLVSLIPLGGDVLVRSTEGLRWPLRDEVLAFGLARGVSNEMLSEVASVRVHSGHLLCVHTHKVWQR